MPDNDFETDGKDPVEAIFITQAKQEMVNTGGEFRLPCFLETMSDVGLCSRLEVFGLWAD